MAPLNILICGGGCGGPALAFWLARAGHNVTIVERYPALRAAGAQIDLRAQGIEVVKRMGLLDTIRSQLVDEAGVRWVDAQNNTWALIMANKSGKGAQSLTSEYEIMRGDLVRILYGATEHNVTYMFGKTVKHFEQDDKSVTVTFSDGKTGQYDLLVGADGQGSRIRKAILPPDGPDPLRHVGVYVAFWVVPRTETDSNIRRTYLAPKSRMIMARSHNEAETQAYFFLVDDSDELRSMPRASVEQQKAFWTQRFRDAGWESQRFIDGMQTAENFYCQEIVQVKTDTWSKGRVVLLADAGYCPSPLTGMGTTNALVGAYVLAGEINRHPDNLDQALANYDNVLRPFINETQKLMAGVFRLAIPQSQFAVDLIRWLGWIVTSLRIPDLLSRFSSEDKGGWPLPDYGDVRQEEGSERA